MKNVLLVHVKDNFRYLFVLFYLLLPACQPAAPENRSFQAVEHKKYHQEVVVPIRVVLPAHDTGYVFERVYFYLW